MAIAIDKYTLLQKSQQQLQERQEAESSLQQNEEHFRQIAENVREVLFLLDTKTDGILYISPAYEKVWGRSCQSLYEDPQSWLSAIHPEDAHKALATIETQFRTGEEFEEEFRIIRPDGSVRWVWSRAFPIRDHQGKVQRFVGITEDITKRKQAEIELIASQEKYYSLFENCNDAIITHDLEGNILDSNPRINELLGYTTSEFLKLKLSQLHPSHIHNQCRNLLQKVLDKQFLKFEIEFQRQSGEIFPAEVSASICEISGQKFVQEIIRDITERKKAEQSLKQLNEQLEFRAEQKTIQLIQTNQKLQQEIKKREKIADNFRASEEKYRSVVNSLKEVVFQIDNSGLWQFINPAWTEITGFSVSETLGTNFLEYIHPKDREINLEQLQYLLIGKQNYARYETRYLHKNGDFYWVEVLVRLMHNKQGEIIGTAGTISDITKRKQAEQELIAALNKEKELSELKSRFVSMTSHEFRTPLAIISSSAGLLQNYHYKLTQDKKDKHLDRIQSSVKHMTQLLEDVLLINRAEINKLQFNPVAMDVVSFCQNLTEEIQMSHPSHFINFSYSIAEDRQQKSYKSYLDEKLLRQIIINLLSNAIKYSPEKSSIKMKVILEKTKIIFHIIDEGIGVPEQDKPRLFESFHRAENVGNIPGTGLGLAIVKKCVDLHNGEINFDSSDQKGTTFTVKIPSHNTLYVN